jgi:microcystin-dependent protein
MAEYTISPNIPDLPDGWKGTPNQLISHIRNTTTWSVTINTAPADTGAGTTTPVSGGTGGVVIPTATAVEVPIGGIIMWPWQTPIPDNYKECNGQILDSSQHDTYPDLFDKVMIGSSLNYNGGGSLAGQLSSGAYRLPDLQGRVPMGSGQGYAYPDLNSSMKLPFWGHGKFYGNMFPVTMAGRNYASQPTWVGVPPAISAIRNKGAISTNKASNPSDPSLWDSTVPCLTVKFIMRVK